MTDLAAFIDARLSDSGLPDVWIAAIREVVKLHAQAVQASKDMLPTLDRMTGEQIGQRVGEVAAWSKALLALAQPFRGHDGWRDEWEAGE